MRRHHRLLPLFLTSLLACSNDPHDARSELDAGGPGPIQKETDAGAGANDEDAAAPIPGVGSALLDALRARLRGDRTGACVAAALIDGDSTETVFVCADEENPRALDADTAFEIGSITKTMTAFLLAEAVREGKLELDDSLSAHLPEGTTVPSYGDVPIRLRDLVTHTSSLPELPPNFAPDPENPYATLTAQQVFDSLGAVELDAEPGTRWAYSNYGYMLLSAIVTRTFERSFESLLEERVFTPLGMKSAFVARAPSDVAIAQGHLSTGSETPAWDFQDDLAGIGGVRASLADMVLYARAALGEGPVEVVRSLRVAQDELPSGHGAPKMGMGWILEPLGEGEVAWHDGGTGGFSSWIVVDRSARRALVLLLDTSWSNLGGVTELASHLFTPAAFPLPPPRTTETAPAELVEELQGSYLLAGALPVELRAKEGVLFVQAAGQPEFELRYDSYGDFYPVEFDALLTPAPLADGRLTFVWRQGGGALPAERLE